MKNLYKFVSKYLTGKVYIKKISELQERAKLKPSMFTCHLPSYGHIVGDTPLLSWLEEVLHWQLFDNRSSFHVGTHAGDQVVQPCKTHPHLSPTAMTGMPIFGRRQASSSLPDQQHQHLWWRLHFSNSISNQMQ